MFISFFRLGVCQCQPDVIGKFCSEQCPATPSSSYVSLQENIPLSLSLPDPLQSEWWYGYFDAPEVSQSTGIMVSFQAKDGSSSSNFEVLSRLFCPPEIPEDDSGWSFSSSEDAMEVIDGVAPQVSRKFRTSLTFDGYFVVNSTHSCPISKKQLFSDIILSGAFLDFMISKFASYFQN